MSTGAQVWAHPDRSSTIQCFKQYNWIRWRNKSYHIVIQFILLSCVCVFSPLLSWYCFDLKVWTYSIMVGIIVRKLRSSSSCTCNCFMFQVESIKWDTNYHQFISPPVDQLTNQNISRPIDKSNCLSTSRPDKQFNHVATSWYSQFINSHNYCCSLNKWLLLTM